MAESKRTPVSAKASGGAEEKGQGFGNGPGPD